MRRRVRTLTLTIAAGFLAAMAFGVTGATASGAAPAAHQSTGGATTPIKHLVVIFGENVSFDHYFGTYPFAANPAGEPAFTAKPGTPTVNGLYSGLDAAGQPTGPLLTTNPNLSNPQRLGHSDGSPEPVPSSTPNLAVMDYYDGNTVTGLWNLAQQYAMNDNAYTTNYGPSTPGAFNVTTAQTYGAICGPTSATINDTACSAPSGLNTTTPAATTSITIPTSQDPGTGTNYSDADPTYDICTYLPSSDGGDGRAAASTLTMSGGGELRQPAAGVVPQDPGLPGRARRLLRPER